MTDNAQDHKVDLDTLTDDEVRNLTPEQVQALMENDGVDGDQNNDESLVNDEILPNSDNDTEFEDDDTSGSGEEDQKDTSDFSEEDTDGVEEDSNDSTSEDESKNSQEGKTEKPTEPDANQKPKEDDKEKDKPPVKASEADDFFKKVTAPFKADGKELQVRSAEDAIRLMQMGVNYSRRMQEMKPMKAIDQMLRQNGINSVEKLNELIDISKGNPEAIQKLLKDKGIDPLDIDTTKETGYRPTNHQVDPKDMDFQEAIDNTIAAEGGLELIQDINSQWDDTSKAALRDQPSIFQNLLEQKESGVYGKVKAELEYQRTMGFLTNVPFLQGYHQVADAMQKAGVFGSTQDHSNNVVPKKQPIDTGTRKAANSTKTEQPNPNLSSTNQPRIAPSNGGNQNEPDYSAMSDEDFLKMAPPS